MGTVAALFLTLGPVTSPIVPDQPVLLPGLGLGSLPGQPPPGMAAVQPLAGLPVLARTAVILLVVILFVALAAIAWDTPGASWLPGNVRGWVWWALLTGALGLAGWFFAATVTFGADFGTGWQLALGYLGGGLPFALIAALLQPSWVINLASGGACAGLIVLGFVLVASHPAYQHNALSLSFSYLKYLLSSAPSPIRLYGQLGG